MYSFLQQPLLRLGPGATWGKVLRHIPEEQYTMVHGSCLTVGVGGYLLGGGSNVAGPPMRYGSGAENVLEYTMVTAEGEILTVDKDRVVRKNYEGHEVRGGIAVVSAIAPAAHVTSAPGVIDVYATSISAGAAIAIACRWCCCCFFS